MVGHLDVRAVDPGMPSSLSRDGGHRPAAREARLPRASRSPTRWRWRAVADRFGSAGAAVRALRAGEDVVLMPPDPAAARDGDRGRRTRRAARRRPASTRPPPGWSRCCCTSAAARDRPRSGRIERRGLRAAVGRRASPRSPGPAAAGWSAAACGSPARRRRSTRFRAAAAAAGLEVVARPPKNGQEAAGPTTTVRLVGHAERRRAATSSSRWTRPTCSGRSSAPGGEARDLRRPPARCSALVSVLLGRASAPRATLPVAGPRPCPATGC